MKAFYFFTVLGYFNVFHAQLENSSTNLNLSNPKNDNLQFKVNPNDILKPPRKPSNYLEIPKNQWDITKEKKYNRGKYFTNKLNRENNDLPISTFRRNQSFGDIMTQSESLNIVCRDHQYVDGDVVEVILNGKTLGRVLLNASYKGFKVYLAEGFNKIEFKALNVGSSYPNTAELIVKDDGGNLLSENQWMLDTGFKASILVIKQ